MYILKFINKTYNTKVAYVHQSLLFDVEYAHTLTFLSLTHNAHEVWLSVSPVSSSAYTARAQCAPHPATAVFHSLASKLTVHKQPTSVHTSAVLQHSGKLTALARHCTLFLLLELHSYRCWTFSVDMRAHSQR
jgi:2-oxoglutarate dehydrogenase complex dehydrogenase (E1) component-like enzyme